MGERETRGAQKSNKVETRRESWRGAEGTDGEGRKGRQRPGDSKRLQSRSTFHSPHPSHQPENESAMEQGRTRHVKYRALSTCNYRSVSARLLVLFPIPTPTKLKPGFSPKSQAPGSGVGRKGRRSSLSEPCFVFFNNLIEIKATDHQCLAKLLGRRICESGVNAIRGSDQRLLEPASGEGLITTMEKTALGLALLMRGLVDERCKSSYRRERGAEMTKE